MYNKLLFIIVVILVPIAVISFNKKETNFNLSKNNKTITISLKNNDNIVEEIEFHLNLKMKHIIIIQKKNQEKRI